MVLLVLVALAAAPSQVSVDPRQSTLTLQIPTTGVGIEAGSKDNRLSARFAFRAGNSAFDVGLTGAETNSTTGRSTVGDLLAPSLSGKVGLGYSYSTFGNVREMPITRLPDGGISDQIQDLCDVAWSNAALPDGGTQAQAREQEREEKLTELRKKDELSNELDLEISAIDLVLDGGPNESLSNRRLVAEAERKLRDKKLEKGLPSRMKCRAPEHLPPELEEQVKYPSPFHLLFRLAFEAGPQSTDYLDTSTGSRESDVVVPWGAAAALGAFLSGTDLVGLTLRADERRKAESSGSVCTNVPVSGATASPPIYSCEDAALGKPRWKDTWSLRLEWRRYASKTVAWNPSMTVSVDAKPGFGGFSDSGSVTLDAPVYLRFETSEAPKEGQPDNVVVGFALGLTAKWNAGHEPNVTAGFSIFLGGLFDRLTPKP